jgi:hypothetical protein
MPGSDPGNLTLLRNQAEGSKALDLSRSGDRAFTHQNPLSTFNTLPTGLSAAPFPPFQ